MPKTVKDVDDNIGNQDDMVERTETKLLLPVALTERERLELGETIVRTIHTINEKDDARKAAAEAFKAEITELEKSMNLDALTLRRGKVDRHVLCEVVKNYRTGTLRVVRLDTQEEVECRPMTSDERQQGLRFTDEA